MEKKKKTDHILTCAAVRGDLTTIYKKTQIRRTNFIRTSLACFHLLHGPAWRPLNEIIILYEIKNIFDSYSFVSRKCNIVKITVYSVIRLSPRANFFFFFCDIFILHVNVVKKCVLSPLDYG